MKRLEHQVAVVTGAARGIGAAAARRLAQDGARVAVFDMDGAGAAAVAGALGGDGHEAAAWTVDVTDREMVEQAMASVYQRWGRIDILVNNAGIIRDNLIHKMTDLDWTAVMDTHLRGAFLCSQAAQRYMVPQKSGCIVMLSSTSALGSRGQANYSAAKAGLQGLTRTLAIELGQFGIRVNAVAPGFIETDMTRSVADRLGVPYDDFIRAVAGTVPLGRVGQPQDVANVIAFLASAEAAYVSGQVIYVAGGPQG